MPCVLELFSYNNHNIVLKYNLKEIKFGDKFTLSNAEEIFISCKDSAVKYWGFKEVGIPEDQMIDLVKRMKAAGKTTFLEVVDYTEEGCIAGAELAASDEIKKAYLGG